MATLLNKWYAPAAKRAPLFDATPPTVRIYQ